MTTKTSDWQTFLGAGQKKTKKFRRAIMIYYKTQ